MQDLNLKVFNSEVHYVRHSFRLSGLSLTGCRLLQRLMWRPAQHWRHIHFNSNQLQNSPWNQKAAVSTR